MKKYIVQLSQEQRSLLTSLISGDPLYPKHSIFHWKFDSIGEALQII